MRDLIVIGYPDVKAAEAAHDALLSLERADICRLCEVVVATRDEKGAIKLSHFVHSLALNPERGRCRDCSSERSFCIRFSALSRAPGQAPSARA